MDDLPSGLFETQEEAARYANDILDGDIPAVEAELDRLNAVANRDASSFIGFSIWKIDGPNVELFQVIYREHLSFF